ncbi:hypothetical protein AAGF08_03325 [Algoriphagus sp. SE2]|uniref:hypothetical protein n=1 Tax=Algoriphagus sp. SE2 TaxID=3141536 RepID=UPI0031CD2C8E
MKIPTNYSSFMPYKKPFFLLAKRFLVMNTKINRTFLFVNGQCQIAVYSEQLAVYPSEESGSEQYPQLVSLRDESLEIEGRERFVKQGQIAFLLVIASGAWQSQTSNFLPSYSVTFGLWKLNSK